MEEYGRAIEDADTALFHCAPSDQAKKAEAKLCKGRVLAGKPRAFQKKLLNLCSSGRLQECLSRAASSSGPQSIPEYIGRDRINKAARCFSTTRPRTTRYLFS